jgi:hypothetical protein
MSPGDLRTAILLAGLILGRLLGIPALGVAAVTGVMFWHGYEIGQKVGAPGGCSADNLGAILLLAFMTLLLGVVWSLMARDLRRGKVPVVPPRYVLVVLAFLVAGFATGAFASAALGRLPVHSAA